MAKDEIADLQKRFAAMGIEAEVVRSAKVPAGWLYVTSEPEFVGKLPDDFATKIHFPPGPPACLAEKEMAEHGSIALRIPTSVRGEDNTIGPDWTLAVGGTVLVRASQTGFFMVPLEQDSQGWFVQCGAEKIRVVWSEGRQRWVVEQIPGRT